MKNFRIIGIVLLIATVLTETHSVFTYLFPIKAEIDVRDWFVIPVPFYVSLKWWIKFNTDSIFLCTLLFCFGRVSKQVSSRLFVIVSIWFYYFALDYLMFLLHYKLQYPAYYVLIVAVAYTVYNVYKPEKKEKGGAVKKMFDE